MTTQTDELVIDQMKLGDLKEHPDNPRKHFDKHVLEEMAASIRQVGVLVPLLVRQQGSYWQILAGARRFRAAKLAELETVPVIVRDLDDSAALELMVLDNLQRQDLHPLEEAAGFQQLMKVAGYDVARVSERVGRSVKYVYDRVKLLELVPEAKKVFHEGLIQAGHAILLARLKPEDQKRAITVDADHYQKQQALFADEYSIGEEEPEKNGNKYAGLKARSVRELQAWIDEHVKFDTARDADPMLFPDTAEALRVAAAEKTKVIPITREHYTPEDARDGNRVFGPRSWRRADGEMTEVPPHWKTVKSKTCEKSGLGVIMVGEGRGEAFQVCVNRTCEVHFPQQAKKAKKRAAAPGGSSEEHATAGREALEQAQRDEIRQRWLKARPAILVAIGQKVKGASVASLADQLIRALHQWNTVKSDAVPRGRTAEDLVRHLAFVQICSEAGSEFALERTLPAAAKRFGINAAKILNEIAPVQTSAPEKGKRAKKGGKR